MADRKNWAEGDPQFDHLRPSSKRREDPLYEKNKLQRNLKKDIANVRRTKNNQINKDDQI